MYCIEDHDSTVYCLLQSSRGGVRDVRRGWVTGISVIGVGVGCWIVRYITQGNYKWFVVHNAHFILTPPVVLKTAIITYSITFTVCSGCCPMFTDDGLIVNNLAIFCFCWDSPCAAVLNNFEYFAIDSIRCVLLGNCLDWTAGEGVGEVLYNNNLGCGRHFCYITLYGEGVVKKWPFLALYNLYTAPNEGR